MKIFLQKMAGTRNRKLLIEPARGGLPTHRSSGVIEILEYRTEIEKKDAISVNESIIQRLC